MSDRTSALPLCLLFICLALFLIPGCGGSGNSVSSEEPPVFSPLQVLVPEAPGTNTIGYSPLILDISNISQGYLTAISDVAKSKVYIFDLIDEKKVEIRNCKLKQQHLFCKTMKK